MSNLGVYKHPAVEWPFDNHADGKMHVLMLIAHAESRWWMMKGVICTGSEPRRACLLYIYTTYRKLKQFANLQDHPFPNAALKFKSQMMKPIILLQVSFLTGTKPHFSSE